MDIPLAFLWANSAEPALHYTAQCFVGVIRESTVVVTGSIARGAGGGVDSRCCWFLLDMRNICLDLEILALIELCLVPMQLDYHLPHIIDLVKKCYLHIRSSNRPQTNTLPVEGSVPTR